MASLQKKVKNGREYWYIMESARVNGKPRIVKQVYLGTAEKLAQLVKGEVGPKRQTRRVKPIDVADCRYGREMALFNMAQRLGVVEIIDEVFGEKNQGSFSLGQMVTAAAIHQACDPASKQALPKWYRKTALPTKTGWNIPDNHFSQNWWNNLHDTTEVQVHELQARLLQRMKEVFGIETGLLLYDPTNFYTFISRHHLHPERIQLPQYGKNKRKRDDLLQVNLAMVATADGGIPMMAHTYAGNITDMMIFKELFPAWSKRILEITGDDDHTIVYDRGNVSGNALRMLEGDSRFVCTLKPYDFKELIFRPLSEYTKPELLTSRGNRLKVWKGKADVYGEERTVVMTANSSSARRELQVFMERLNRQWKKAQQYINDDVNTGKQKFIPTVRSELNKRLLKYYDLTGLFKATIRKKRGRGANGKLVVKLSLNKAKFAYRLHKMGKQIITTNRHRWKSRQVVRSMTSVWRVEDLFRKMNNSDYLSIHPMFHWTDAMIRMHHLVIMLSLQLMTLCHREVCHAELEDYVSFDELFEELEEVKEYLLIYPHSKKTTVMIRNNSTLAPEVLEVLGLQVS